MYYEERMIDGVLCWRNTPDGDWKAVDPETLARRLTDTERQRDYFEVALDRMTTELREAKKRCGRLEGALRLIESLDARSCSSLMHGPMIAAAALSEPDEMTQAMQEGKV